VNESHIQLALFEAFSIATFWSCFCRAAHTDKRNTRRDVRWAFTLLGVAAILCAVAPLFHYQPDGISVLLAGAIAVVQLVTSHHWRHGVPVRFRPNSPCAKCDGKKANDG
jgi:hypothetical protein